MTDRRERRESAFRLNLEQQRKRAKELLRAARAADPAALKRIGAIHGAPAPARAGLKLADAQRAVARELGFGSWPALKSHVGAMERERAAIGSAQAVPDAGSRTVHVRCGSDIRATLIDAGFSVDFLEHAYPYCQGPVTDGTGSLEQRARFLSEAFGHRIGATYEELLARCRDDENRLAASARDYDRAVLWMEHDSYDQLALVRCLACYARTGTPPMLELIDIDRFPGSERFLGLGQLPAEALRLLWSRRQTVTPAQLALGAETWTALTADDPRRLAALAQRGARALPHLAPALHRHLQELPSVDDGLGLTEQLILKLLADGPSPRRTLFRRLTHEIEPLPWLGDWGFFHVLDRMEAAAAAPFDRMPAASERDDDELALNDVGRDVLRGAIDWLALDPPARWVGGIEIVPAARCFRWDEARKEAVLI